MDSILEEATTQWIYNNFNQLSPKKHFIFENLSKPGYQELTKIFSEKLPPANDTSIGVGYAPFSELEILVLKIESCPALRLFTPKQVKTLK